MSKKRFSSVWDAVENSSVLTENMKLRSELAMALQEYISKQELTQAAAARLFKVSQPRVSDLVRGKIHLFALDTLIDMACAAGMRVEMRLKRAA